MVLFCCSTPFFSLHISFSKHVYYFLCPQAGLSVAQGKVDEAVAEREAVEAVNVAQAQTKAALGAEMEGNSLFG